MSKRITECRGIAGPSAPDCVEKPEEHAAVLAPCKVEADTCTLVTGDAASGKAPEPAEECGSMSGECFCDCAE